MKTNPSHLFALAALALFARETVVSSVTQPLQQYGSQNGDPRTPLTASTTPGDADSVFRITAPGSYYLTKNLSGPLGKHGIQVEAPDVTIDLMGFHLEGQPGTGSAIRAEIGSDGLRVHSGTIGSWTQNGIDASSAARCVAEDLVVHDNGGRGVYLGTDARVRNATVQGNSNVGVQTAAGARLVEVIARDNSQGIMVQAGSSLLGCSAFDNSGAGIRVVGEGLVRDCVMRGNGTEGLTAGQWTSVADVLATSNTTDGVFVFGGGQVHGTVAAENGGDGVHVTGPALVQGLLSTENGSHGIEARNSGLVHHSVAAANTGAGVYAGDGTFVQRNALVSQATTDQGVLFDGYFGSATENGLFDNGIESTTGVGFNLISVHQTGWGGIANTISSIVNIETR